MIGNVVKKAWIVALLGAVAAVLIFAGSSSRPESATASSGTTIAPLLSCPNVDGSVDNSVRIADILILVQAYYKDYPSTNYVFMYDLDAPYNPETGAGGQQRIGDILAVVTKYYNVCPLVDTQVAQATRWAIDMDLNPGNGMQPVPQIESEAAIEAIGYYQGSNDVPGQGVHYINNQNWDGVFNPAAPEGLVYNNGRLVAQLYVADANVVGLGTHTVGPCNPGCAGAEYNIELETAADGPQCSPACSWNGAEVWHLHHYLCTVDIGTSAAFAIPGAFAPVIANSDAACASYSGDPQCTVPVTAQPCYQWQHDSGWMGHLYNWIPNNNRIADQGTEDPGDPDGQGPCTDGIDNGNDGLTDGADPNCTNGRFADCFPDGGSWKATNCPG